MAMRQTTRCDTCRLQATQAPQTLYDVLVYLSPPVELIDAVERWAAMKPLPEPVLAYLSRWQALRTGEPMPAVDGKFNEVQNGLPF